VYFYKYFANRDDLRAFICTSRVFCNSIACSDCIFSYRFLVSAYFWWLFFYFQEYLRVFHGSKEYFDNFLSPGVPIFNQETKMSRTETPLKISWVSFFLKGWDEKSHGEIGKKCKETKKATITKSQVTL
jgi:hypothetical protein